MKNRPTLTPSILMSAAKRMEEKFGEPSQIIVNPNIDLKELNKPLPKKTPEEIEQERVRYAMEQVELIEKMRMHFQNYEIKFYEEEGYFITATTHSGKTVRNDYNFYDHYAYDLNTAIKDLLEQVK